MCIRDRVMRMMSLLAQKKGTELTYRMEEKDVYKRQGWK